MSIDLYRGLTKAPESDMPLVVAFHGTGGDAHQLFSIAQPPASGRSDVESVHICGMAFKIDPY
ncbi:MAG: hypothetical protein AAF755_01480 [Pseudomonadota bacterium]